MCVEMKSTRMFWGYGKMLVGIDVEPKTPEERLLVDELRKTIKIGRILLILVALAWSAAIILQAI